MRPWSMSLARLALATVLPLSLAGATGCGGGSSGPKITDARAEALSYMPRDAAATVEIPTDPKSPQIAATLGLIRRFPFGGVVLTQLRSTLERPGHSYDQDIKPVLGNPVFLSPTAKLGSGGTGFIAALVARDAGKLNALNKAGGIKTGDHGGFAVYRDASGNSARAIKGPVELIARDETDIDAAIDRHDAKSGERPSDLDPLASGLPAQALMRVSGSVAALIAAASTGAANRVPLVGATKGYAATVSASSSGLALDLRVDTSGGSLTPDDLPLAAGDQPAPLPSGDAVDIGARDLSHQVSFLLGVERMANPSGLAHFRAVLANLTAGSGVDVLKELTTQFTGPAQAVSDLHSFALRAKASDPAALRRALARLTRIAESRLHVSAAAGPGGLTVLRNLGNGTVTVGVIGDQLMVGTIAPGALLSFAIRPATALAGAHGPFAMRFGLGKLIAPFASLIGTQGVAGQIAQGVFGRIGDVTGYASEDPRGLTAHFELPIR